MEIRLLAGAVTRIRGGAPKTVVGSSQSFVVARLALAAPGGVALTDLVIEARSNKGSIEKAISRAREFGLTIENRDLHYYLELPQDAVDAHDFLAAAEADASTQTREETLAALDLWAGGPPDFSGLSPMAEAAFVVLHQAHEELIRRSTATPKRVLIVEDKTGARFQDGLALRGIATELVIDVAGYNAVADVNGFDLVLLDLHLTDGYSDQTGADIAKSIMAAGYDVPVLAMTAGRPYSDGDVQKFVAEHGLVGLVFKFGDGADHSLANVFDAVAEVLAVPRESAGIMTMEAGIVRLRATAKARLLARGASGGDHVDTDADKLHRLARDGDAPTLKRGLAAFTKAWLS